MTMDKKTHLFWLLYHFTKLYHQFYVKPFTILSLALLFNALRCNGR